MLVIFELPGPAETHEYQVKAAMLYKFAMFVEWPDQSFSSATSPFVVGVLGKDPFGPWLQREMGETSIGTHPVEIRHIKPGEAAGCHLVFIGAAEPPRLREMLIRLRKTTTALLISDVNDIRQFCRCGGMIGLVVEGGKVRFTLNSSAIVRAGLKIDSNLQRIALSTDCGRGR